MLTTPYSKTVNRSPGPGAYLARVQCFQVLNDSSADLQQHRPISIMKQALQDAGGLLISMIGRAHHRTTGNLAETQFFAQYPQLLEFVRVYKTVNR